jgi:hypothetical protein
MCTLKVLCSVTLTVLFSVLQFAMLLVLCRLIQRMYSSQSGQSVDFIQENGLHFMQI